MRKKTVEVPETQSCQCWRALQGDEPVAMQGPIPMLQTAQKTGCDAPVQDIDRAVDVPVIRELQLPTIDKVQDTAQVSQMQVIDEIVQIQQVMQCQVPVVQTVRTTVEVPQRRTRCHAETSSSSSRAEVLQIQLR